MNALDSASTRPYLIRALYEWCTDNGFTPYVAVSVDESVQVPREYVKNNEIVLNIGFAATSALQLGNEFIEFKARFAGSAREILVPISHVTAIYARENGQGMAFPMVTASAGSAAVKDAGPVTLDPSTASLVSAATSSADGPDNRFMQLVPESSPGVAEQDSDSPEPPAPPPRTRPSLKRVK